MLAIALFLLSFAPTAVQAKDSRSCPKWEAKFREYGLPVKEFSYIAWRESRCRIKAINAIWENGKIVWTLNKNGSYDSGLLQINSVHKTLVRRVCKGGLEKLLELDCNLLVAKHLYDAYGLEPWKVYKKSSSVESSKDTTSGLS
jgi:hypothetical protein